MKAIEMLELLAYDDLTAANCFRLMQYGLDADDVVAKALFEYSRLCKKYREMIVDMGEK